MRIVFATDAWPPQINGVSRTVETTIRELQKLGHEVEAVHPGLFKTVRCPFSTDIQLAYNIPLNFPEPYLTPDSALHIATEGPIGFAFRSYCVKRRLPFTTAYHTNYPEYLWKNAWVPPFLTRGYMRWFHGWSSAIMVATERLAQKVKAMKIKAPARIWSRGVDLALFHPRTKSVLFNRPMALYVGRVSHEKNIEAFLDARNDVEKFVVGDGPQLEKLKNKYRDCHFTGPLRGEELAQMYANADVFVFPSKTDTFGLVVIEALASGVPVAAYPVEGPIDILGAMEGVGCCNDNLELAIDKALKEKSVEACLKLASRYTWQASTDQFLKNLVPI